MWRLESDRVCGGWKAIALLARLRAIALLEVEGDCICGSWRAIALQNVEGDRAFEEMEGDRIKDKKAIALAEDWRAIALLRFSEVRRSRFWRG